MNPIFNYIITIHNKEDLIESVLNGVIKCCHENSFIYPVLDGCTDMTEKIIDEMILKNVSVPIRKIFTPDVHETRSINAGLFNSDQKHYGFNIILQDDVIIDDYYIEEKIKYIYDWSKKPLGIISLRMGANFKKDWLTGGGSIPFNNLCENIYGHGTLGAKIIFEGQFTYRAFPFKSPVCIPCEIINQFGILEEKLSPHTYDDLEYAIRLIKAGYRNGVFALRFHSKKEWGGTRRNQQNVTEVQKRNINFIREWYKGMNDEKEFYGVDMKIYNTIYYKRSISINNLSILIRHKIMSFLSSIRRLLK